MDVALEKSENKCQKNSWNIQKMDNYIQKDIHNPKLKFWGVTELPLKQNLVPRFTESKGKENGQDEQISIRRKQDG